MNDPGSGIDFDVFAGALQVWPIAFVVLGAIATLVGAVRGWGVVTGPHSRSQAVQACLAMAIGIAAILGGAWGMGFFGA